MRPAGSPSDWVDLLDSLVPDILALVIATWQGMAPPAPDALEDRISETLCRHLRQGRDRCDLPFTIQTQLVELDPAAGQDQGRMDIVFVPTMVPRENIYFCLECKRLNVPDQNRIRPYSSEYVRFGLLRFVTGQYAPVVRNGGMLGYVLDGNVAGALARVEANIRSRHVALGMEPPGIFLRSSILPGDDWVRETRHRRAHSGSSPIVIHHLFMPPTSGLAPSRQRRRPGINPLHGGPQGKPGRKGSR
jgi:hypothetical protein